MPTLSISRVNLFVFDQDEALRFYTDTLGFEVGDDQDLGFMRWLTVHPSGRPEVQLILCDPTPIASPEGIGLLKQVLDARLGGAPILATDDVRTLHAELVAKGVTFTQDLVEAPYGTDCELQDPFGNRLRILQAP